MKIFILIFLSFCLFVLSAGDTQEEDYNNQYEGTLSQLPMKEEEDNEPQYETTLDQPPPPDQLYETQYEPTLDQPLPTDQLYETQYEPTLDQAPLDEAQENDYVTDQGSSVHV